MLVSHAAGAPLRTGSAPSDFGRPTPDGEFLVFDWGGGTMDSTILLHEDGFFDEKASRGVNRLGGLEIDERL